jgi:manganese-dependent ADP-ribose/CDP-alcohol diphosphatase
MVGSRGGTIDDLLVPPLFSFGLIADVQYVDRDNGTDFSGSKVRRYRQSLKSLERAVKVWNKEISGTEKISTLNIGVELKYNTFLNQNTKIMFICQLGDLIDGFNREDGTRYIAIREVLKVLKKCICRKIYHCIGNHELYNFKREELQRLLKVYKCSNFSCFCHQSSSISKRNTLHGQYSNICKLQRSFYSFSPFPGWSFIILDPYFYSTISPEAISLYFKSSDINISNLPKNYDKQKLQELSRLYKESAYRYLCKYNPNDLKSDADWLTGLKGPKMRFAPFNGAFGVIQREWLRKELKRLKNMRHYVVIFTHIALHPSSCINSCLVWDYEETWEILRENNTQNVYEYLESNDRNLYSESNQNLFTQLPNESKKYLKCNRRVKCESSSEDGHIKFYNDITNQKKDQNGCNNTKKGNNYNNNNKNNSAFSIFAEKISSSHSFSERNVVAVFSGHDHSGGYGVDEVGIHHVTLEAPLEAPEDVLSFATVEVYNNYLLVKGRGSVTSRKLVFNG